MAEELHFHLEQRTEDLIRTGVPRTEALRRARIEFGCLEAYKENCREERGLRLFDELGMDLRYAIRTFRNHPAITAVAVVSFALGIGANTAMFTLADSLLFRPLPVSHPEQLVVMTDSEKSSEPSRYSYPDYVALREHAPGFSELAARTVVFSPPVDAGSQSQAVSAEFVSGNYFSILGARAFVGRLLNPDDDRRQGEMVAVLSYDFWQGQFGGDSAVLGRTIRVNGQPFEVVGVSEPRFFGTEVGEAPDIRLPAPTVAKVVQWNLDKPASEDWIVFGRLKPAVTIEQAAASTSAVLAEVQRRTGAAYAWDSGPARERYMSRRAVLQPASRGVSKLRNRLQRPLVALMAVAGLVLMIACANVAGLLLARAASRRREIALRTALGAGSWRLIRQLLVESCLLSLAGGAAGALVAFTAAEAIVSVLPSAGGPSMRGMMAHLDTAPDLRALAFTLAACLLTGVLCGLAPAAHARCAGLANAVNDRWRGGAGTQKLPLWKALVVVQVALSVLLLVGAGLFLRTFRNLLMLDFGMDRSQVAQLLLRTPDQRAYAGRWDQVLGRVLESVESVPGVRSCALSTLGFVDGAPARVFVGPFQPGAGGPVTSMEKVVTSRYFDTLGIPILRGAVWTAEAKSGVAVVNEAFVKRYLADREPIGQTIQFDGYKDLYRIVGIAKDARYAALREDPQPAFYFPERGMHWYLYVRTTPPPEGMISTLRRRVNAVDPNLEVSRVRTLDEETESSVAQERLVAWISGCFGVIATLLAAVGLFGVVAYSVLRQTQEIGIRMALGAARPHVLGLVARDLLVITGLGILVGLALATALTEFARSLLFGLSPGDPLVLLGASLVMACVAALAGLLPTQRALSIDPATSLRHE